MSKTSKRSPSGKITLISTYKESASTHTEVSTSYRIEPTDDKETVRMVYSYEKENFIKYSSRKQTETYEISVEDLIEFIKSKGTKT